MRHQPLLGYRVGVPEDLLDSPQDGLTVMHDSLSATDGAGPRTGPPPIIRLGLTAHAPWIRICLMGVQGARPATCGDRPTRFYHLLTARRAEPE